MNAFGINVNIIEQHVTNEARMIQFTAEEVKSSVELFLYYEHSIRAKKYWKVCTIRQCSGDIWCVHMCKCRYQRRSQGSQKSKCMAIEHLGIQIITPYRKSKCIPIQHPGMQMITS